MLYADFMTMFRKQWVSISVPVQTIRTVRNIDINSQSYLENNSARSNVYDIHESLES